MYIINFSYKLQFGGELCEEQTQKIQKNDQKTTPLQQLRDEMGLKLETPKRHISDPYQMYIPDFSFFAQFGGELCEEQTQKKENPTKKSLFRGCQGMIWG